MIKRIDIPCFGSFIDFVWRESVRDGGNVQEFKRLNILYGRNYAGKTTLSRIVRCLEVRKLPDHFSGASFAIATDSVVIDERKITSHNLDVRVYNNDFVDDHLGFLRDHDGRITPFAIVGSENKAIEEKMAKIKEELGNVDEKTGLRHMHAEKLADLISKRDVATKAETNLKAKLTAKATQRPGGIKHNPIYRDSNYNTLKIETDIQTVRSMSFQVLVEEEKSVRQALLSEVALPDIGRYLVFSSSVENLHRQAQELVSKRILPSLPLQDLLDDALLQAWVKTGMPHHRDKRTTCGFCGQTLPPDLWAKLDAHFSKESEDLHEALGRQIVMIEEEFRKAGQVLSLTEDDFYATNRRSFREHKHALDEELARYVTELDAIKRVVETRRDDIFTSRLLPDLECNSAGIEKQIATINALIKSNNEKTQSLAADQDLARRELRLSEIAQFIQDIDLSAEEKRLESLRNESERAKTEEQGLSIRATELEREVEDLLTHLKDERKGAERVNDYLNHFFGHGGLRLVAVQESESSGFKFEIFRGDDPAYNLSEGECSLVAFCYFVAKLEDAETKGKELIVYIDDPVSSLDSNHIFFVFSLIESVLGKPEKNPDGSNRFRYQQLFVSTHNLDFFKYLKCLSTPKGNHGGTAYFLVERGEKGSQLSLMPSYLRDYTTEFNYLFSQIYKCRDSEYAKVNHECFYSFGNNLRKFLEAYLFYKYPCQDDKNDKSERLKKFFGDDPASTALTSRITNELSHLEEIFDRSMRPIEIPEIPKLANFVLDKIYEKDPDQYNALLKSIGESQRQ